MTIPIPQNLVTSAAPFAPLTPGTYLTQSGETAVIDEVHPVAAFGHVGAEKVIWTAWGENHNEAFRLVRKWPTIPDPDRRRKNDAPESTPL